MAGREMHTGPTAETVRQNISHFRKELGMTYAELARSLEQRGHAIPPLGLRRIEAGERRVDVDDLVALALALDVNPHALLFPRVIGDDLMGVVTGGVEVRTPRIWDWARGLNGYSTLDRTIGQRVRPHRVLVAAERSAIRDRWRKARIEEIEEEHARHLAELSDGDRRPVDAADVGWSDDELLAQLKDIDPEDDEAWAGVSDDPAPPSLEIQPNSISAATKDA